MTLPSRHIALLVALLLPACGVSVQVQTTAAPNRDLPALRRFALAPADPKPNPLLDSQVQSAIARFLSDNAYFNQPDDVHLLTQQADPQRQKNLAAASSQILQSHGYILDNDHPDFLLATSFSEGRVDYFIPSRINDYPPGAIRTVVKPNGQKVYVLNPLGRGDQFLDGINDSIPLNAYQITLIDPSTFSLSNRDGSVKLLDPLWTGSIINLGNTLSDPITQTLLTELLAEFPTPTHKPRYRMIKSR